MCGRLTLTEKEARELAEALAAELDAGADEYRPRYNIAPTQEHWIAREVDGRRRLELARWGWRFAPRRRDGAAAGRPRLVFNTVSETALGRGLFREALFTRRCVVPASGFYEWRGPEHARMPVHFHRPDGGLLFLAGIYDRPRPDGERASRGPGGGERERAVAFSILTTAPNAAVARVHDRMPAVLLPDQLDDWLRAPGDHLLRPAPDDWLVGTPASPRVNSVDNDDPDLLTPPPGEGDDRRPGAKKQLGLFD